MARRGSSGGILVTLWVFAGGGLILWLWAGSLDPNCNYIEAGAGCFTRQLGAAATPIAGIAAAVLCALAVLATVLYVWRRFFR